MPLGFIDNSSSGTATPRILPFTFTQGISNGKTTTAIFPQNGVSSTGGTCTFYQWGRKDPFRKSGNPTASGGVKQSIAIQHPNTFYTTVNDDWSSPDYNYGYDYWNVGNTDTNTSTAVKKSIYDPSPVGYKLPPCTAFSSLCIGQNKFTVQGNGYLNTSNNDFWQFFGRVSRGNGSIISEGDEGVFWSASPTNNTEGYNLLLYKDGVVKLEAYYGRRSSGFPVRPVSE